MKLALVLDQHFKAKAPLALDRSLGDSYLLLNNRVYHSVRTQTTSLGFKFSDQPSKQYITFPMSQLDEILRNKSIPYFDNVTPIENLNKRTNSSLDWDHILDNLRPNYVFHEACHAIARGNQPVGESKQSKILITLIEESFANACEFLAIADAKEPIHRVYLEVNSYFTVFEDRTHLKKVIDQLGLAQMARFIILCYLHSNFLNENFSDADFKRILNLAAFQNKADTKALKSLAQNAFALNPRFRYTTTEMYLRLNGIDSSVNQALNFDYLKLITEDQSLKKYIDDLATTTEISHV